MSPKARNIRRASQRVLAGWLDSCKYKGKLSRNTIAVGIVVLDHLRKACPVSRDEVISARGEIKGARSGLHSVLEAYGVPGSYLKEVTTRQAHQDGQRLFEGLGWGNELVALTKEARDELLQELIQALSNEANDWLQRQNLKLEIDRRQEPVTWVQMIVESAKERSGGILEQHLVGAKLERLYKDITIPNHPAHAADVQTGRPGDFAVEQSVFHVTAMPSWDVVQKCAVNIREGLHPILLIPNDQKERARVLAQEERIDTQVTIYSLEDYVSMNIVELAHEEHKDFFGVLKEIIQVYNRRLEEAETDLSLQIEVR